MTYSTFQVLGWYLMPGALIGFLVVHMETKADRLPADLPAWAVCLAALLISPFWPVILIEAIAGMFRAVWRRFAIWRCRRRLAALERMAAQLTSEGPNTEHPHGYP